MESEADLKNRLKAAASLLPQGLTANAEELRHQLDQAKFRKQANSGNSSAFALLALFLVLGVVISCWLSWDERLWGRSVPPESPDGTWGWEEERFGFSQAKGRILLFGGGGAAMVVVAMFLRSGSKNSYASSLLRLSRDIGSLEAKVAEAQRRLQNLNSNVLIIDSNIWMNKDYDWFFMLCTSAASPKKPLRMFGVQFDEICNLKKKRRFGSDGSSAARLAINRIEIFQKADLLRIASIGVEAQGRAYADPVLIRSAIKTGLQANGFAFLTNDREMRIRVRELAAEAGMRNASVDSPEVILYS